MKNIKCIIFDFGNVLTHNQLEVYVDKMVDLIGIKKELFLSDYFSYRREYDRGAVTTKEYWTAILNKHNISLSESDLELLTEYDIKSWTCIDEKMIAYIQSIKKDVTSLAILSNMNYDVLNFINKTCSWLNHFDYKIYSCEHLIIKPEMKIYEKTIDTVGFKAEECLFIDDLLDNIKGAREYGINAMHYKDFESFVSELNLNYILV